MSRQRWLAMLAMGLPAVFGGCLAVAQVNAPEHWITGWATAVYAPAADQPVETFENQTIRMVVRTTLAGSSVRVRFSNELSSDPLNIGAAHIALAGTGCSIVPGSDHPLTFGGQRSIIVPPGAPALSDPIDLNLPALGSLAISLFLPDKSVATTFHGHGQHPSCVFGPGDLTAQGDAVNPVEKKSWYWLSSVQVLASADTGGIATLGDSITDGARAQAVYADWPDQLAMRLNSSPATASRFSVMNEGIGGNRLLHEITGPNALSRLDRDVLSQPGLRDLVVLEGINDIGWPYIKIPPTPGKPDAPLFPYGQQKVSADQLIQSLRQIVERGHAHGVRVFGCTLTPYEGAAYYSTEGEAIREAVNQWIRTSHVFDGVIDFDAAVRDPDNPNQYLARYQSGDWLHPSDAGYAAMAGAINLSLFEPQPASGK
jgi:lysophospholipase L1-like esterase